MENFYNTRTVKWESGKVLLIDQTSLPRRLTYVECIDHMEVASAIRNMFVRGAPAIGVAAAMGIALAAYRSRARTRDALRKEIEHAADELISTRPTAVNLYWAIKRMINKMKTVGGNLADLQAAMIKEAQILADEDVATNILIGKNGAPLVDDGDTVLTHCK